MRCPAGTSVQLVQVCNVFGDGIYLPLAAGMLRAHAASQPDLARHYRFAPIVCERFDLADAAAHLDASGVVGLSTYVWSWEYSIALARRLRELHPGVVIVLGGPQVPDDARPRVASGLCDVAVHGEGEATFADVLRALRDGSPVGEIPGVTARGARGEPARAPARLRLDDLDALASPFLRGDFDPILAGRYRPIGLWETNRGCPFSCTFCYWGSAVGEKVRTFGWDRLMAELRWFERHRIDYVLCADANFGIKRRDLDLARAVAEQKRRSGFPRKFRIFSTKNASQRVMDVVDVLSAEGLDQGVSLTMQSLSPPALAAIGRRNIKLDAYVTLAKEARRRGMTSYSDLIVGLPGETYDSFLDGLEALMDVGQHDNVHVYVCTLLVGSEMSDPGYVARHGIRTARSPIIERHMRAGALPAGGIQEYEDIVIETATMPVDQWIETNVATVLVNVLHYQKVAPMLALYLHHERGVRFRRWYEAVKRRAGLASRAPLLAGAAAYARDFYRSIAEGRTARLVLPEFGDVVWPVEEAVFLRLCRHFDELGQELRALALDLGAEDGLDLDPGLLDELLALQLARVPRPGGPARAMVALEHDWPAWLEAVLSGEPARLVRRRVLVRLEDQHGDTRALPDYARKVAWYARSAADIPYRLTRLADPEGHAPPPVEPGGAPIAGAPA
ncbi:MAG: radical SAM protein [Polyangiaceae bacterium]|nr:radical SAM protein [Polyangiaceae bacterium]